MEFREATQEDLPDIIMLLHDDDLGKTREHIDDQVSEAYSTAFRDIINEVNNKLFVLNNNGQIIGVMQLMIIPHISRGGSKRAQIDSVRIHSGFRGQGLGKKLMQFALEKAKESGCSIVQLTTDKKRELAHKFYLDLGFSDTHIGMKIHI